MTKKLDPQHRMSGPIRSSTASRMGGVADDVAEQAERQMRFVGERRLRLLAGIALVAVEAGDCGLGHRHRETVDGKDEAVAAEPRHLFLGQRPRHAPAPGLAGTERVEGAKISVNTGPLVMAPLDRRRRPAAHSRRKPGGNDERNGERARGAHDRQPAGGGCGDRVPYRGRGARRPHALPAGRRDRPAQALDQLHQRPAQGPSRPRDRPDRADIPVHPVGRQGGL